jgi:VWFA-related protein
MGTKSWTRLAALSLAIGVPGVRLSGQIGTGEPIPPRLTKLSVVALDNRGRPVSDLTAADFQITDAGKPEKITLFRHDEPKLQQPRLGPNEVSNRGAANFSHATLVLFDLLNQSFTIRGGAQNYLIEGLRKLESADNLFLYLLTVHGDLYPVHPLPLDKTAASGDGSGAPWTRNSKALIEQAVGQVYGLRGPNLDIDTRIRMTYASLESVARLLAAVPGRKSVVWVTHGVPITLGPSADTAGDFVDYTPLLRRMAETFGRDSVAIYPVQQAPPGMAGDGTPEARFSGIGSEDTLKQFADLTGGSIRFSGDIGPAIRQAMSDVQTSYLLGYLQPPEEWDGKFHKLNVTCSRKGVRLQFKTGYYAAAEVPADEQESLRQVMASSFDAAEIGIRGKLVPDPSGKSLLLECHLDPADVPMEQSASGWVAHLAFQVEGIHAGGQSEHTAVTPFEVKLNAEEHVKALADGIPLARTIAFNDAWKKLRLAVVDRDSHAVGSLTLPVTK